jgi:hypothetical protein
MAFAYKGKSGNGALQIPIRGPEMPGYQSQGDQQHGGKDILQGIARGDMRKQGAGHREEKPRIGPFLEQGKPGNQHGGDTQDFLLKGEFSCFH